MGSHRIKQRKNDDYSSKQRESCEVVNEMFQIMKFIAIFKKKIDDILDEDIISGKKKDDILELAEWTYLVNISIYLTVKQYSKKYNTRLNIIPERGGRFPSDFTIKSSKCVELVIEHENNPSRIGYNYRKLIKTKAKERLIICYVNRKKDIELKINELKKEKNTMNTRKKVHILIANKGDKEFFETSAQFQYDSI